MLIVQRCFASLLFLQMPPRASPANRGDPGPGTSAARAVPVAPKKTKKSFLETCVSALKATQPVSVAAAGLTLLRLIAARKREPLITPVDWGSDIYHGQRQIFEGIPPMPAVYYDIVKYEMLVYGDPVS